MPYKGDFSLFVPGKQILEINNTNNNETLKKPPTQGGGVPQEGSVLKLLLICTLPPYHERHV